MKRLGQTLPPGLVKASDDRDARIEERLETIRALRRESDDAVPFEHIKIIIDACWPIMFDHGFDAAANVFLDLTAEFPDSLRFAGLYHAREVQFTLGELGDFARRGRNLQPFDGARLFDNGPDALAIRLARSFGPRKMDATIDDFFLERALRRRGVSLLILHDGLDLSYLGGFGSFYRRLDDAIHWLEDIAADYDKAFYLGQSATGYSALYFAGRSRIKAVMGLSAPTLHDPTEARAAFYRQRVAKLVGEHRMDLRPLFESWDGAAHLWYGVGRSADARYAQHLDGCPGVRLFPLDTTNHGLLNRWGDEEINAAVDMMLSDIKPGAHR
jgi:hypothetical protein